MMWVKLTLAPVVRASWLFRMSRLTSSRRAGTVRTLVAVGTPRLASMLATILDAAPRSGVASSGAASTAEADAAVADAAWRVDDGPAWRPGGRRARALGGVTGTTWGWGAGTGADR